MFGQGPIYVLSQDGQQLAYDIAQVQQMLADRLLTPETYFWQEGMADWRPLSELLLPPSPEAVPDFVPQKRGENPARAHRLLENRTRDEAHDGY